MKRFECGTLVPGCNWSTEAEDEAEVVRRAVEHLKMAHEEHAIRPNLVSEIKARIRDAKASAA